LDHYKRPRNRRDIERPTHSGTGNNPFCGDYIEVALVASDGLVSDAVFRGRGCSVCIASASMMTELVRNQPMQYVRDLCSEFTRWVDDDEFSWEVPMELEPLTLVRGHSARRKCMALAWEALANAMR
jgi:nitrogen fixation NifU-like protein